MKKVFKGQCYAIFIQIIILFSVVDPDQNCLYRIRTSGTGSETWDPNK
jgi:hypothetical protein